MGDPKREVIPRDLNAFSANFVKKTFFNFL